MFFAIATFDLKNPTGKDYEKAYAALERFGLSRSIGRKTLLTAGLKLLPTTTVAGSVDGTDTDAVADSLCDNIKRAFEAQGLRGAEIFVHVSQGVGHYCQRLTS